VLNKFQTTKENMPKLKLDEQWLRDQNACGDGLEFATKHKFDFAKLYDKCERGDWMIWVLRRAKLIYKPQAVRIAVFCAEHVLGIYEKKYPEDKRPQQAIEAAKEWVNNPNEENRKAAYAAAYAAYTAYAAADAAAADAAADADRKKECKWQADKIRELIPNPLK
jgi:hypothetical protein